MHAVNKRCIKLFLTKDQLQTVLFVTHRMSSVTLADRVLFLQAGKISGLASHEQLLQDNKDYRELYELQKNAYC